MFYCTSLLDNSQENDTLLTMTHAPLHEAAIEAALKQDWKRAIDINQQILNVDPANIDALNRLGFAYLKTGKLDDAKRAFKLVIKYDPYNKIAAKNIQRLEDLSGECSDGTDFPETISPLSFLEDPGKTKITQCVHAAPQKILSTLHCGQEVFLKAKNHGIEIRDSRQRYLGALPDDISFRLIKMIQANNNYKAYVKNVDKNSLTILVREVSRGKRFQNQPSFLSTTSFQSFTRDLPSEGDRPDTTPTGEEEEEATPES